MANTTKEKIAELQSEVGKLAAAHNELVAAHNRMARTLEQLGQDLAGGINAQHLAIDTSVTTLVKLLAAKNLLSTEEWSTAFAAAHEQAATEAIQAFQQETAEEQAAQSSIIT